MSVKDCPDCRRVGCPTWTDARKFPSYTRALNDCIDAQERLRGAAFVMGVAFVDFVSVMLWDDPKAELYYEHSARNLARKSKGCGC